VGDAHENTCGQKCPFAYKIISPTSDGEKRGAYTHITSDLSSNESFDTFGTNTCCGSHVFNLFYRRLTLFEQHFEQHRTMAIDDSSGQTNPLQTPPIPNPTSTTSRMVYRVMPRPGQPRALHFDGKNISEFLDNWNLEYIDYGYYDGEKCTHFPRYCEKMIKDVVKLLSGHISHN
jgi:hypothetical protein